MSLEVIHAVRTVSLVAVRALPFGYKPYQVRELTLDRRSSALAQQLHRLVLPTTQGSLLLILIVLVLLPLHLGI